MGTLFGMEISTKTTERLRVLLPVLSFLTMLMAFYFVYSAWTYRSGWDDAMQSINANKAAFCVLRPGDIGRVP